ncbi:MAG: SDR family NAD(P)-dependent oxidoreductase [Pseudomonadota bacterium]
MKSRFSLEGRTALVTGASSGLGAHFARTLAAAGANVVLAARRRERIEALARDLQGSGASALAVALDVSGSSASSTPPAGADDAQAAFARAQEAFGPVHIVVNNAGVSQEAFIAAMDEDKWRHVMDVNLDGVFRVGQAAARHMQAHGEGGSIINIASILGFAVTKTLGAYAASKAAVLSLTRSMALELARDNIRVNAIAPGYFSTEINADFLASQQGQGMLAAVPMRRHGELEELSGPLLLLASDAGAYMTGSVIVADGGHLLVGG